MSFNIKEELKRVPEQPGVYLMHDKNDTVIYVGKAVVLKNRLSSYFRKGAHNARITKMISRIAYFEYIVTDSEYEALVLECNLIKKYYPPYNVLLKDGGGYPYIKVTVSEPFPRAELAHEIKHDKDRYFGPFRSIWSVYATLDALRSIFPLRLCNKAIRPGSRERVCLNYHIGLCSGPCGGRISQEEYKEYVDGICTFLSGKQEDVRHRLEQEMLAAADALKFERAAKIRDGINALDHLTEKQNADLARENDCDVIAVAKNSKDACLQIFFMRGGKILGREFFMFEGAADEKEEELIQTFIQQFYRENKMIPSKIYTATELEPGNAALISQWLSELAGRKCHLLTAQRGEMREITAMVKNNASIMLLNSVSKDCDVRVADARVLEIIRETLHLKTLPRRIEAYDISNTGDSDINASMIVYVDAKPAKQEYKRFKMKEITSRNDVGSMREVLTRRFSRWQNGDAAFSELPDLLFLDGGIGQLNVAKEVLQSFSLDIPAYGMVKDNRHRTRALLGPYGEYRLQENPELWRFVASVQDEAHRFAITYNRKLTEKRYKKSLLDDIPGVGKQRKIALLKRFGSYSGIKKASVEDLTAVPGISRKLANQIYQALQNG